MLPPGLALLAAATCAAALGAPVPGPEDGWSLSVAEAPLPGAADVSETRWTSARPPVGPFDRIGLHRYRKPGPQAAALLYLPGTNMNGQAALQDEDHNLWIFLARRGVEVFTLDYRTHAVPATGPVDLAFMRGWDLAAFVEDVRAAVARARAESGRPRLFVAGFSRGVSLAWAWAATQPEAVAGIVALDGAFKNHAPTGAYDHAAELARLEASGAWGTDVAGRMGWEARRKLMEAVSADPDAPAPDGRFPTVGTQLAEVLYAAWRPGGLANARGGVSRPQPLARLLAGYDRYYPAVQTVDGQSIADRADDPRTPLDDRWGEMGTPVLNFTSTGMGGEWLLNSIFTADRSGSRDVTLHVLEGYGHLDLLVGERARAEVFEPTLAWIRERAGPASNQDKGEGR
jgi:alpha-beta hydrolase superfamily lysophospholipase